MYVSVHIYRHVYVYLYTCTRKETGERERERERATPCQWCMKRGRSSRTKRATQHRLMLSSMHLCPILITTTLSTPHTRTHTHTQTHTYTLPVHASWAQLLWAHATTSSQWCGASLLPPIYAWFILSVSGCVCLCVGVSVCLCWGDVEECGGR